LQSVVDNYHKAVGVFEQAQTYRREGEVIINELSVESSNLSDEIHKFEKFEHALRTLPQQEALEQQKALSLKNYSMDFSEGFNIRSNLGTPYECLSTGERMMVDVSLCFKFQDFMRTAPGWCFVDDSELVTTTDDILKDAPDSMQLFFARVGNIGGIVVEMNGSTNHE
jgi:hypothetical protein